MRTSALPSLLGERSWRKFRLHKGWAGIILCMMWEEARGDDSKWSVYLSENISHYYYELFANSLWLQEVCQRSSIRPCFGQPRSARNLVERQCVVSRIASSCLYGTQVDIIEKIGKEEAEKDYREKLLPAIQVSINVVSIVYH